MDEEELEEMADELKSELVNPETSSSRLAELFATHPECGISPCEVCVELSDTYLMDVRDSVLRHPQCSDELTDLALNTALKADKLVFVDALLSAVTRPNLPQKWLDFALDYEWKYAVQFQPEVLYHFIHNISLGRSLSDEQKLRIQAANDLGSRFPSAEEMAERGWSLPESGSVS